MAGRDIVHVPHAFGKGVADDLDLTPATGSRIGRATLPGSPFHAPAAADIPPASPAPPPAARSRALLLLRRLRQRRQDRGWSWPGTATPIEIADDDAERARGLMFRDAMAADHGMLFIHDREEPQAYWMKNTQIPLDILYFDDARRLVAQQRDVPPCSLGDALPAVSQQRARALRAGTQCRRGREARLQGRRPTLRLRARASPTAPADHERLQRLARARGAAQP